MRLGTKGDGEKRNRRGEERKVGRRENRRRNRRGNVLSRVLVASLTVGIIMIICLEIVLLAIELRVCFVVEAPQISALQGDSLKADYLKADYLKADGKETDRTRIEVEKAEVSRVVFMEQDSVGASGKADEITDENYGQIADGNSDQIADEAVGEAMDGALVEEPGSQKKTMYLTFDDGPSAKNTEKILDILKEREIKATFFVVGENVRKYPEVAKRIAEEGHTIGIHCDYHGYSSLYESVESYVADFEKAYETVLEVTGVEATLFRFPGGSINAYNQTVYEDIIIEMTNRGFIYFDWNASLEDAVKNPVGANLLQNARESTLGRKRIIMLAHDTVSETAKCLEELIDQFPEYQMKPLTQDVAPIQF